MAELTFFAPPEYAAPEAVQRQADLFAEASFLGDMLDRVPSIILILNRERQLVFANQAALRAARKAKLEEVLGLRPGQLLSCEHFTKNKAGCGTTRFCRYCGIAKALLAANDVAPVAEDCHIRTTCPDLPGAYDLRAWASTFRMGDDQFTFTVLADIADEKRRIFLERIFLHDLLNTATSLYGYSELLMLPETDLQRVADNLRTLHSQTEHLTEQIRAHQQLVEAEQGELVPQVAAIDSTRVLNDVRNAYFAHQLGSNKVRLKVEDETPVAMETDPTLLRRVLANMVKNAIEASKPGETVKLRCSAENGHVIFSVQNPTFLPENIAMKIFNRSFSTKGAGRGLGTYSMKILTERYLGGSLVFTSNDEEGTIFTAKLPRKFRPSSGEAAFPRLKTD